MIIWIIRNIYDEPTVTYFLYLVASYIQIMFKNKLLIIFTTLIMLPSGLKAWFNLY